MTVKLRNRRRIQWINYTDRLMRLDARLPRREEPTIDEPFDGTDPIQVLLPGYLRMHQRWERRKGVAYRDRMKRHSKQYRRVEHWPTWEPADLPINAAGDTQPGFMCVHPLENGNGLCEGTVFDTTVDAQYPHACIVYRGGEGW